MATASCGHAARPARLPARLRAHADGAAARLRYATTRNSSGNAISKPSLRNPATSARRCLVERRVTQPVRRWRSTSTTSAYLRNVRFEGHASSSKRQRADRRCWPLSRAPWAGRYSSRWPRAGTPPAHHRALARRAAKPRPGRLAVAPLALDVVLHHAGARRRSARTPGERDRRSHRARLRAWAASSTDRPRGRRSGTRASRPRSSTRRQLIEPVACSCRSSMMASGADTQRIAGLRGDATSTDVAGKRGRGADRPRKLRRRCRSTADYGASSNTARFRGGSRGGSRRAAVTVCRMHMSRWLASWG